MTLCQRLGPFISGMMTAFLITALIGTGFAVSEKISFNTASLRINGEEVFAKDKDIVTASGASVPSIILYTDENGGKTHYIPVRKFAETFRLPIDWDGETSCIDLKVGKDLELYLLDTKFGGDMIQFNNELQIIDTIPTRDGTVILPEKTHFSKDNFETVLNLHRNAGQLVNVTITNESEYKPVEVRLGNWSRQNEGAASVRFKLLPKETVTHTMKIIATNEANVPSPYVFVGNPDEVYRLVNVTVSAIQFSSTS